MQTQFGIITTAKTVSNPIVTWYPQKKKILQQTNDNLNVVSQGYLFTMYKVHKYDNFKVH